MFFFILTQVDHNSVLADVSLPPLVSTIKKKNPRAFQPPGPPPVLSNIRDPQTSSKGPKVKIPYKEVDEASTQDAMGEDYPDMDEGTK